MTQIDWKQLTKRRLLGLVTMGLGVFVLVSPVVIGEWVISLLGVVLIAAGLFQFVQTLRAADETASWLSYIAGSVTILLGLLLFLAPGLVLSGTLLVVMVLMVADGVAKIAGALKQKGSDRRWGLANGIFTILLGLLIVRLLAGKLGIVAISVILGLRLLVEGWRMFLLPEKGFLPADFKLDTRQHPDRRLRLEPSDAVKEMHDGLLHSAPMVDSQNIVWCLMLFGIFLAIHVMRTDPEWSFIGFISPITALLGDTVVAILLAILLALPMRLVWRRLSRPFERAAWNRFHRMQEANLSMSPAGKAVKYWLERRNEVSHRDAPIS